METLKDLWASLIAGIRDRTTNPLTVAFVISWCLWNFQFFVVLFGDGSAALRLKAIEEMYLNVKEALTGGAFLYPLISAVLYVFLYPVIGMAAVWVYRSYQVATANLVKRVEKQRTITREERDTLVRGHEKELTRLSDEVESLATQLTATRSALAEAEDRLAEAQSMAQVHPSDANPSVKESISTLEEEEEADHDSEPRDALVLPPSEALSSELDTDKIRILMHLSKFTGTVSIDVISGNLGMNPTLAKSELRGLKQRGLVQVDRYGHWSLTERGVQVTLPILKKSKR